MSDLDAKTFAHELSTRFNATRAEANQTDTSGAWSRHVFPLLADIAEDHGLWWAGLNTGRQRSRTGESREYLWDFTMYRPDTDGLWNLPRVIIEHENVHTLAAFRYDHWKTLCGLAPLRVAIGYVGADASQRKQWVASINDAAEVNANAWYYPAGTEDLIALGYYGMTQGSANYEFWCRRDDERRWTPLTLPLA